MLDGPKLSLLRSLESEDQVGVLCQSVQLGARSPVPRRPVRMDALCAGPRFRPFVIGYACGLPAALLGRRVTTIRIS
jgi:hypothetical protein